DEAAVLARVDGDRQFLKELVNVFAEDCPRLLADVRAALAQKDGPGLQFAAHTLKGAAGNFDAQRTVAAALQLETLASANDFAAATDACVMLENAIAESLVALRNITASSLQEQESAR